MANNWIAPGGDIATQRTLIAPPPPPPQQRLPTTKYDSLFAAEGRRAHIDPALLKALGWQESSVEPWQWNSARDPNTGQLKYYKGLMELSADNQKTYHVSNPYDAGQSIAGGTSYFAHCLWQNNGDVARALQQYNGSPLSKAYDEGSYADQVFKKYKQLTGQQAPDFFSQFVRPHPTRGPGPATDTTPPARVETDEQGDPILDDQGDLIPKQAPTRGSGPAATPIQSPLAPMLRPGSIGAPPDEPLPSPTLKPTPPLVHPSMNKGPSSGPNLARGRPDPLAAVATPTVAPAANRGDMQSAFNLASRAPVQSQQPSGQSPSPFIQAFLSNAIFGGNAAGARIGGMLGLDPYSSLQIGGASNSSSAPYPYAGAPDARPGGRGGR